MNSKASRLDWRLAAGLLTLTGTALAAWILSRREPIPSSLSHLKVGRVWEYDVHPGGGTERTEVLRSWTLPDGREAFRLEFRQGDIRLDADFTSDPAGHLIQLAQSGGTTTFEPPLVGLGQLRIGARWSSNSMMIMPSKFRASSPTVVSGQVVGFETVTVPAGSFQAYRIEQVTNGRPCTAWHAPGIGLIREVAEDQELVLRLVT